MSGASFIGLIGTCLMFEFVALRLDFREILGF